LKTGDVADGEKISKWLYEDLKELFGEQGYIEYTAEVVPTFKDNPRSPSEGIIDLEVDIYEGRRFKLGSISLSLASGRDDMAEQALRQIFLVHEGDIFNQRLFQESIKRVNDLGWFDYVDADRDVDFRTNREEGIISVVIKCNKREN